jgi:hypothetical protein
MDIVRVFVIISDFPDYSTGLLEIPANSEVDTLTRPYRQFFEAASRPTGFIFGWSGMRF